MPENLIENIKNAETKAAEIVKQAENLRSKKISELSNTFEKELQTQQQQSAIMKEEILVKAQTDAQEYKISKELDLEKQIATLKKTVNNNKEMVTSLILDKIFKGS